MILKLESQRVQMLREAAQESLQTGRHLQEKLR